ncbi:MAG: acyl--CoA ligase [Firmicutes bacterium]|nr:acyl--CoA ligase [Bacillota bacterium]
MTSTSIVEKLFLYAKKTPDKAAVIFEKEIVTYGELWDNTVRCAHLFSKLGLRENDRIIIQCRYSLFYLASIYAAHLCGAAVVLVDKNANGDMIADMAEQVDAQLAVCNMETERFANTVLYGILAEGLTEDTSMDNLAFPAPESVAVILFTTGTTGAPKGVQLTQRNTTGWATIMCEYSDSDSEVFLYAVPLNHVAPFMRLQHTIYIGGTVIFMESMMKIGKVFEYVEKYGVNALYFPPAGITMLQHLSKDKLAKYANQLGFVGSGSAAMTVSQRDYLKNMLPKTFLYTTYGSSETGLVSLYRYDNSDKPINCCGRALPGVELRIVDDGFHTVPAGRVGSIAIKSDLVMKGYYKRPELTAAVMYDGFFVSEDLGYIDEDGYLYVCGRKDDMINIGGLKVFPSEIENAALKIPGIAECICFGVSDPITGQAVKLVIRTDDTAALTAAQVQTELGRVMDAYKVPKSVEFTTEIAKTANGKPNRKFYQQKG